MAQVKSNATTVSSPGEERIGFFGDSPSRIQWSAVFGGAVAGIGIWLMLYALGLALGFSSIDTANADNLRGAGLFSGIWSVVAPLVGLFAAGAIAGRGAGVVHKVDGALHGVVVWALAVLAAVGLAVTLLTALLSGVFSAGKTAVEAGGAAVGGVAGGAAGGAGGLGEFSLDANDALAPVNERLRAAGKPEVSADQLQAAAKDILAEARQGRLDREVLSRSLVDQKILSENDANELAGRVEAQFNAVKAKAGQTAQEGAVKAADVSGKILWAIFAVLFLGLASAIFGATIGVSTRGAE